MKTIILSITLILAMTAGTKAQVKAYSADDIMRRCSSKDTVYIINFWATWCIPCVQELPEFNTLQAKYAGKPVKVLLVSLDFKEDRTYKLQSFLDRKHITPEVVWLSDTDPNIFIPKIENAWQGSIPATLILLPAKHERKFIEGSITAQQVGNVADGFLSEK